MPSDRPVGFFDSGLGGVSVLREAVRMLPSENFIYYGDDANAPYGTRTEDEILELALKSTDYLADRRVKAIVVACNTATSISIKAMRARYKVPVVSIEPAVKPAVEKYETGTIAVFATPATLRQERFQALVDRLGASERVRGVACPELAGLIEFGSLKAPELRTYIRERVCELAEEPAVNALVMGCTHYTFASSLIQDEAMRMLCGECTVFDGAEGTARQLKRVLSERGLLRNSAEAGQVKFISSAGRRAEERMRLFFRHGGSGPLSAAERRENA